MARYARSVADGRRRRGRRGADDLGHDPSGLDAALRSDADRPGFIAAGGAIDDRGGNGGRLPACAPGDPRRPDGGATLRIDASERSICWVAAWTFSGTCCCYNHEDWRRKCFKICVMAYECWRKILASR